MFLYLTNEEKDVIIPLILNDMQGRKEKIMNERIIKLADVDEVCDFVKAAGKCDFDVDVSYQRMVIDAKSILGVIGLGIEKELTVKYHGNDLGFENVLSKYVVA